LPQRDGTSEGKGKLMNGDSVSGSTLDFAKNPSTFGEPFGWVFQQLRIAFRDLASGVGPGIPSDHEKDICRMAMCLKGDLRICVTGPDRTRDFLVPPGNCSLQYQPGQCPCLQCAHHDLAQVLELVCQANAFAELMAGTALGRELKEALSAGRPWQIHQPMSPALHRTLVRLRDSLAQTGKASASLVLAKALETVWMLSDSALAAEPRPVSDDTRRAVDKARAILESNMAAPPDLETLAAEVGMSLSKLKEVFPQVCGMPPYAYLRQIRMERAWRLLAGRRLSVTEAAREVGYTNLSHFAKVFSAHHGFKP